MRNSSRPEIEELKFDKLSLDKLHQIHLQEMQEIPIDPINLHINYSIGLTIYIANVIEFKIKGTQKTEGSRRNSSQGVI